MLKYGFWFWMFVSLLSSILCSRAGNIGLVRRDVPGWANLTSANPIWPLKAVPVAGFRRVYTSPSGKSATLANCQMTSSVSVFTFINGMGFGVSFDYLTVPLNPFSNLFAFGVDTTGNLLDF
ncbi:hypothetical protein C8J57DRAFT_1504120 [Mycena rebaudengoi]|nr:hypothetical protein C8J57DRAFT_1504120 [Mycena rebaudengoi]